MVRNGGNPTVEKTRRAKPHGRLNAASHWFLAAFAWFIIWEILALLVGQEILLAKPATVAGKLLELASTAGFWSSVLFSVTRIACGFLASLIFGAVLAVAAFGVRAIEIFLKPMMSILKAAPVASYIILCLLFTPSGILSALIAFTMALPVIYTNTLNGFRTLDPRLNEMASVYGVGLRRRVGGIYLSQLLPHLVSACGLSLGLCWKAGVAAEVIGLPRGSIGEALYRAKVFVDTPAVMAWTAVVILISYMFEKLFLGFLRGLVSAAERI